MKKDCSHPNCRLIATKHHPNEDKDLCDTHYNEALSVNKTRPGLVLLTYPNK